LVCFIIQSRCLPAELSIPALESRIERAQAGPSAQDDVNELSVSLAKLSKDLADAAGSLPSYDQKQYELVRFHLSSSLRMIYMHSASKRIRKIH
jgi:hypothetical protein